MSERARVANAKSEKSQWPPVVAKPPKNNYFDWTSSYAAIHTWRTTRLGYLTNKQHYCGRPQ